MWDVSTLQEMEWAMDEALGGVVQEVEQAAAAVLKEVDCVGLVLHSQQEKHFYAASSSVPSLVNLLARPSFTTPYSRCAHYVCTHWFSLESMRHTRHRASNA